MPEMDYTLLVDRMKEYGYTQLTLADRIGIVRASLNMKLNGKRAFKIWEIARICDILDIPTEEIGRFFFTPKPQPAG